MSVNFLSSPVFTASPLISKKPQLSQASLKFSRIDMSLPQEATPVSVSRVNAMPKPTKPVDNGGGIAPPLTEGKDKPSSLRFGDVNGDYMVDLSDLALVLSKYGTDDARVDVNSDGKVDNKDVDILTAYYGQDVSKLAKQRPHANQFGDVTGDGKVDLSDLGQVLSQYGSSNRKADINQDGIVNDSDVKILTAYYGQDITKFLPDGSNVAGTDGPIPKGIDSTVSESRVRGDMNHDGVVNDADTPLFIKALSGYSDGDYLNYMAADMDGNGRVNGFDIQGFTEALAGTTDGSSGAIPVDGVPGEPVQLTGFTEDTLPQAVPFEGTPGEATLVEGFLEAKAEAVEYYNKVADYSKLVIKAKFIGVAEAKVDILG